ncbi:MAG: hypothetical protein Q7T80_17265 [Methanoregula sp.]|nr:hypothetical protein [Methanoregula sp.]
MKKNSFVLVVLMLAALLAVTPVTCGSNDTWDPAYYLTHGETLAGQKDMSRYSNIQKPEPIHTMNKTTARLYPNVTWCGSSGCMVNRPCSFPFTRCESPLTIMIMYNVNATHPGQPGPVIGYGVTGWPLQNSVSIVGNPNLILPFKTVTGLVNSGRIGTAEKKPSTWYADREYLDYANAPALTSGQKETAMRIASSSKKFQAYLDGPHGPITAMWAYPYSGIVRLSMTAGSATSPEYGLVSVTVDPVRGQPGNVSFVDWKKYW